MSPAQFADVINVQRSSISHLISGRNKPSLEFIQKILKTFPEIDSDWLLFGKGEMNTTQKGESGSANIEKLPSPPSSSDLFLEDELFHEEVVPEQKNSEIEKPREIKKSEGDKTIKKRASEPEVKKIEKIVFFYKDNTFHEYFPES